MFCSTILKLKCPKNRSENLCRKSLYFADLPINLISLRYPVVVIPCRDCFNGVIKHWSSGGVKVLPPPPLLYPPLLLNSGPQVKKVCTLDIKIKRAIHTQVLIPEKKILFAVTQI